MIYDPYEYQRSLERAPREPEQERNTCPLGRPEDYESQEAYELHKQLLRDEHRG